MSKGQGYRGYNGSRPYAGLDFPHNVQNFIIRNYCQKYQYTYLLSATEYKMPSCYMILEEVISVIDTLEGIVLFSLFMLPESRERRMRMYETVLNSGCSIHGALEDVAIRNWDDVQMAEDILTLNRIAHTDQTMQPIQEFVAA